MKIFISDSTEGGTHGQNVKDSFLAGYNTYGVFNGEIELRLNASYSSSQISADMQEAYDDGYKIFIQSAFGAETFINVATEKYPSLLCIMPAGSNNFEQIYNSNGNLPNIIVTGAGDIANETGYDIEFFAPDPIGAGEPDLSSFANGFIAGQLAYIADTLNVNLWTARYLARLAGLDYSNINGYGKVRVQEAINAYNAETNYGLLDPFINHISEVGSIKAYLRNGKIYIVMGVTGGNTYEVYSSKDGGNYSLLNSGADALYVYDAPFGKFKFKYKSKLTNDYGFVEETEFSEEVTINKVKAKYFG